MPAIITDRFKKDILLALDSDVTDSAHDYYVAVSRPIDWDSSDTAPTPENTEREIRNARLQTISIKKVAAHSFVVPRTSWNIGSVYSAYNDNQVGRPTQNYYVITDENQVYVCVQQAKTDAGVAIASTVKPTGTLTTAFETSDGYRWKFLYSIGALRASQFLAANFMPVTLFGPFDSDDPADHVEQVGIQNAAVAGQIVGYTITAGGTGYTTVPTLTVVGDGTGAKAQATISGGAITKVSLVDSSGLFTFGRNYTRAHVEITGGGGSGAKVRPRFGPKNGLGADPRDDLRSTAMMFHSKPAGNEGDDWVVGNDFRQVLLIRDPDEVDSSVAGNRFTGDTGNALRRLKMSSISTAFTSDKEIVGGTSGAKAYVVKTDSDEIWYVQNEDTLFRDFQEGENITENNGSGAGVLDAAGVDSDTRAYIYPEVDVFNSGEVLFIDNRAAIERSADQSEDIKIIIQL